MTNSATRAFAERLAANKRPMWVRFVLVPDLTDDVDDIKRIASFAATLGNVQHVDVLPFHQLGRYKWKALGIPYQLGQTKLPTPEAVENVSRLFRAEGLMAY
jgi:pyruvate formate lyase activating enzyme